MGLRKDLATWHLQVGTHRYRERITKPFWIHAPHTPNKVPWAPCPPISPCKGSLLESPTMLLWTLGEIPVPSIYLHMKIRLYWAWWLHSTLGQEQVPQDQMRHVIWRNKDRAKDLPRLALSKGSATLTDNRETEVVLTNTWHLGRCVTTYRKVYHNRIS